MLCLFVFTLFKILNFHSFIYWLSCSHCFKIIVITNAFNKHFSNVKAEFYNDILYLLFILYSVSDIRTDFVWPHVDWHLMFCVYWMGFHVITVVLAVFILIISSSGKLFIVTLYFNDYLIILTFLFYSIQ